jgi:hypothetical protein
MSWEFYCNGYISHPAVLGNKISGLVRDTIDEYFTQIKVDGPKVIVGCSCGSRGEICKHAIALLYGWVNDSEGFLNIADTLDRLRDKDKDSLIEMLGRILMFDSRHLYFIEEGFADEDFENDVL